MRGWVARAVLASVLAIAAARAASDGAAGPPAPSGEQETVVHGRPPSLDGRWIVVTTPGTSVDARRGTASLWQVTGAGGQTSLVERSLRPTDVQWGRLGVAWSSTVPVELEGVEESVQPSVVKQARHEIFGQDDLADDLRTEPMVAGALWVIRQCYDFLPGPPRPFREVRVLAATERIAGGYRGRYLDVTFVAAPAPLPIKVEGTFRLLPLASERSTWSRIGDFFRGCNPIAARPAPD
jgi:hypothetical protein